MTEKAAAMTPIRDDILALMRTIEEFGALLTRETAALKEADFITVDSLQQQKRDMAQKYHAQIVTLTARREDISTLDMTMRERLVQARTQFTLVLRDNMRALDAAKDSAKRLVDRILEAARETVVEKRQTHYSSLGRTASYKSATMSLSIDRKL